MEGRNRPGTNYQSSAAASSPPDSYYNYPPNPNHRPDLRSANIRDTITIVAAFAYVICGLIFVFMFFNKLYDNREQRPEFRVDSFSLSNFTFTNGSRVFIDSEVQLTARNPNLKCSLSYEHIAASIYYKHELLFQNGLPPFSHETKNKTSLVAKFAGDGNVVDKWVVDGINGEIGRKRSVGFNLWFISSIAWCNYSFTSTDSDTLKVLCKNLIVGIPSNGSPGRLTGKPKTCLVGKESDVYNRFLR